MKKREYHLWAGIVRVSASPLVIVSAFAPTRKAVAAILMRLDPLAQLDERKFQKVTVSDGWGGAAKADVLELADFISASRRP